MTGVDPCTEQIQIVVPGLALCVCVFSVFVNAPTIQEIFIVWGKKRRLGASRKLLVSSFNL